jgi:hypothetical protein
MANYFQTDDRDDYFAQFESKPRIKKPKPKGWAKSRREEKFAKRVELADKIKKVLPLYNGIDREKLEQIATELTTQKNVAIPVGITWKCAETKSILERIHQYTF